MSATKTETIEATEPPAPPSRAEMLAKYVSRAKHLWSLMLSRATASTFVLPSIPGMTPEAEKFRDEFNALDADFNDQLAKARAHREELEHYKRVTRRAEIRKAREQGTKLAPDQQAEITQKIADAEALAAEYRVMQREMGRDIDAYIVGIPDVALSLDATHKEKLGKQVAVLKKSLAAISSPEFRTEAAQLTWARSGVPSAIQVLPVPLEAVLGEAIRMCEAEMAQEWVPDVGAIPPR